MGDLSFGSFGNLSHLFVLLLDETEGFFIRELGVVVGWVGLSTMWRLVSCILGILWWIVVVGLAVLRLLVGIPTPLLIVTPPLGLWLILAVLWGSIIVVMRGCDDIIFLQLSTYWCTEWKKLATDAKEMCQDTLEIVLDQVSHLCPGVDFCAINLKSRWDPKGRRIYVPEEASGDDLDMAEVPPEVDHEQQPGETGTNLQLGATEQVPQPEVGDGVDGGGECPT
ncbi:hypothetical protein PIB30_098353 [Stylosanthes scabra]|uniref:Uncharacterized protein n=1 Tax=Stylosanthes scabra TaxID=79078 RepID=A0ABU6WXQ1_9FABA|nr:hypothetical protein [Stylosanthes scabra]